MVNCLECEETKFRPLLYFLEFIFMIDAMTLIVASAHQCKLFDLQGMSTLELLLHNGSCL